MTDRARPTATDPDSELCPDHKVVPLDVRVIDSVADHVKADRIQASIWGGASELELLRVLSKTGNYVAAAFRGDRMVGMSSGIFHHPDARCLHSHVAAVVPDERGAGVGVALKRHQRAWALERGVPRITWTFDPLIRRNAHFNLNKLSAQVSEYIVDFFGPMDDDINCEDESDRLLATWHLKEDPLEDHGRLAPDKTYLSVPILTAASDGEPLVASTGSSVVSVAVPENIESMRKTDLAQAVRWRHAVRATLGAEVAAGSRVVQFQSDHGYILIRSTP